LTPLDGLYPVLKPPGMTSHDVVAYVRRLTGERKVGHAGTLDPPAAGVLLVLVGRAGVRLAEYLLDLEKVYLADIHFGLETDTQDYTGRAVGGEVARARCLTRDEVQALLPSFTGRIEQVPPMVSAVKVDGRRLHRLAREGREVERPPRVVQVHDFRLLEFRPGRRPGEVEAAPPGGGTRRSGEPQTAQAAAEALATGTAGRDVLPAARVRVRCSRGTYVRTLAHDLGRSLGTGAHLGFLVRLAVGGFRLSGAATLEEMERAAAAGSLGSLRIPPGEALGHLPAVRPGPQDLERLIRGEPVPLAPDVVGPEAGPVRVLAADGTLVAVAEAAGGRLRPRKVLAGPPVGGGSNG